MSSTGFSSRRICPTTELPNFTASFCNGPGVAVFSQPSSLRKSRTKLVPANEEIMPAVEAILTRACEEIIALASESRSKGKVYALSTHFFSVMTGANGTH